MCGFYTDSIGAAKLRLQVLYGVRLVRTYLLAFPLMRAATLAPFSNGKRGFHPLLPRQANCLLYWALATEPFGRLDFWSRCS